MTTLPDKPPGKRYFILLRTREHSHLGTAIAGGLGQGGNMPPLSFPGTRCICCNAEAQGGTVMVPLTSQYFQAEPLPAPCCPSCTDHALSDTGGEITASMLLVVGVGLAIWLAGNGILWGLAAGGALIVLAIVWLARIRAKRLANAHGGHHPGLEIGLSKEQLALHTPNRDLARDILERMREYVVKAK